MFTVTSQEKSKTNLRILFALSDVNPNFLLKDKARLATLYGVFNNVENLINFTSASILPSEYVTYRT